MQLELKTLREEAQKQPISSLASTMFIVRCFEKALEMVEKQVPRELTYSADGYSEGELVYDNAECPVCGHSFEKHTEGWGCAACPDCTQVLDWNDKMEDEKNE